MVRKGFLHATDAVIGSLLLLVFLSTIFPNPKTIDWKGVHIQKEAEDLLTALDHSGILGKVIVSKDLDVLGTLFSDLVPNTGHYINIRGVPKRSIKIGNLIREEQVQIADTVAGTWEGTGFPPSENEWYRKGEIFGIRFVVSDTQIDNKEKYDTVNFDLNNDTEFNDVFEGPYEFNGVFKCKKTFGVSNDSCYGNYYEIGPITDKLVLFNATYSKELSNNLKSIISPYFNVFYTIDNLNLNYEGLSNQDILLIDEIPLSELTSHVETIKNFLLQDKSIIEIKNINETQMNEPIQEIFNFTNVEKQILGFGDTENIFVSSEDPEQIGYYVSKYFYDIPIKVDTFNTDFTSGSDILYYAGWNVSGINSYDNFYLTQSINIGNRTYNIVLANKSTNYNEAYFSENSIFDNNSGYGVGGTITSGKNSYEIIKIYPLELKPKKPYYFSDYYFKNISSDYGILKRKNYFYHDSEDPNVYTINANTRVYNGSGIVVQIPKKEFYAEDYSLLRGIILYLGTKESSIKSTLISSEAVGVPYLGTFNEGIYLPYTINTVWWYL